VKLKGRGVFITVCTNY